MNLNQPLGPTPAVRNSLTINYIEWQQRQLNFFNLFLYLPPRRNKSIHLFAYIKLFWENEMIEAIY